MSKIFDFGKGATIEVYLTHNYVQLVVDGTKHNLSPSEAVALGEHLLRGADVLRTHGVDPEKIE